MPPKTGAEFTIHKIISGFIGQVCVQIQGIGLKGIMALQKGQYECQQHDVLVSRFGKVGERYLAIVGRKLVQQLLDSVSLPGTVHVRHPVLGQAAEVLVNLSRRGVPDKL